MLNYYQSWKTLDKIFLIKIIKTYFFMKKQIFPVVIGIIKKDSKYLLTKRQSPKKEWNKWQFQAGGGC
jgi:hypothetical protein